MLVDIPGIKETEVNEFMLLGLGLGITFLVMITVFLVCDRKRKRRRLEHPMLPSHAHFHTCESIGERFATSSSMDSVRKFTYIYINTKLLKTIHILFGRGFLGRAVKATVQK